MGPSVTEAAWTAGSGRRRGHAGTAPPGGSRSGSSAAAWPELRFWAGRVPDDQHVSGGGGGGGGAAAARADQAWAPGSPARTTAGSRAVRPARRRKGRGDAEAEPTGPRPPRRRRPGTRGSARSVEEPDERVADGDSERTPPRAARTGGAGQQHQRRNSAGMIREPIAQAVKSPSIRRLLRAAPGQEARGTSTASGGPSPADDRNANPLRIPGNGGFPRRFRIVNPLQASSPSGAGNLFLSKFSRCKPNTRRYCARVPQGSGVSGEEPTDLR